MCYLSSKMTFCKRFQCKMSYLIKKTSLLFLSAVLVSFIPLCLYAESVSAVIGPQGGEIAALDGSLKLSLPAKALNQTFTRSIRTLAQDTSQNSASGGQALIGAAEFLPQGLVFNLPASRLSRKPSI